MHYMTPLCDQHCCMFHTAIPAQSSLMAQSTIAGRHQVHITSGSTLKFLPPHKVKTLYCNPTQSLLLSSVIQVDHELEVPMNVSGTMRLSSNLRIFSGPACRPEAFGSTGTVVIAFTQAFNHSAQSMRPQGISNKNAACDTCGQKLADCAGHFGEWSWLPHLVRARHDWHTEHTEHWFVEPSCVPIHVVNARIPCR